MHACMCLKPQNPLMKYEAYSIRQQRRHRTLGGVLPGLFVHGFFLARTRRTRSWTRPWTRTWTRSWTRSWTRMDQVLDQGLVQDKNIFWEKIMELGLKLVDMAPYELILTLDGALWLTIISKPPWPQEGP